MRRGLMGQGWLGGAKRLSKVAGGSKILEDMSGRTIQKVRAKRARGPCSSLWWRWLKTDAEKLMLVPDYRSVPANRRLRPKAFG